MGQDPSRPYVPRATGQMLSTRERKVIIGFAQGKTANQIAAELFVHNSTVKLALRHAGDRLGLQPNQRGAIRVLVACLQQRWLSLDDIPRNDQ